MTIGYFGKLPLEREFIQYPGYGLPSSLEDAMNMLAGEMDRRGFKLDSSNYPYGGFPGGGYLHGDQLLWSWIPSADQGYRRAHPFCVYLQDADLSKPDINSTVFQQLTDGLAPWLACATDTKDLEESEWLKILAGSGNQTDDQIQLMASMDQLEAPFRNLYGESWLERLSIIHWEVRKLLIPRIHRNTDRSVGILLPISHEHCWRIQIQYWMITLGLHSSKDEWCALWGQNWNVSDSMPWLLIRWGNLVDEDYLNYFLTETRGSVDLRNLTKPTEIDGYFQFAENFEKAYSKD